jgi:DnaJ-class molecular chaperone
MEYRDYYATLGVPKTATPAEIKKAFRRLARKHHPDVNKADPAAEQRFKEANEAYDVLSDPEKRKLYDQLGANWSAYQRAGAAPGAGRTAEGPFAGFGGAQGFPGGVRFEYRGNPEDLEGFSDFFRTFFAGGSASPFEASPRRAATRGEVDIEDLLSGLNMTDSGGARFGDAGNGMGRRSETQRGRGAARRQAAATAEVEVALDEVATGTMRVVQVGSRRLEVQIPAGVGSGQRIRLSGAAAGGAGSVELTILVRPHPVFTRDGANLTREVPITLGEALLGGEVAVETLTGRTLLLRIPPGTQSGRVFRLGGQGLPRFRAEGRGDLLVRTRVVLPTQLDEEGRELAQRLVDHIQQPSPRPAGAHGTIPRSKEASA